MKKIVVGFGLLALFAQSLPAVVWEGSAELKFSQSRKFKIVQFTDIHYLEKVHGDLSMENPTNDVVIKHHKLLATMRGILDAEKPDLVVFTGDNVTSLDQPFEAWRKLVIPVIEREIPWAVVMGNHDHEYSGTSRHELMAFLETLPFSLSQCGLLELGGGGNYALSIISRQSSQVKAVLYCMDSGDYAEKKLSDGYAWFSFPQIMWFRSQCQANTADNGGVPVPSLAFFHIPFPEFNEVLVKGKAVAKVSSPKLNSGMFTAMLESRSILGAFVGHDHGNDYVASYHGICLAFGRKTGAFGYQGAPVEAARVIEIEEGSRRFSTWICNASGERDNFSEQPEDVPTFSAE